MDRHLVSQGGRVRWPWYAGGGAAALCVVAALVFIFAMPEKNGTSAKNDVAKEGPGDPALTYDEVTTNTAQHRGKRVTWSFVPCSTEGKRMMCALDMNEAMGPRHYGLYVVEFGSDQEAGAAFRAAAFTPRSTVTGTLAGEVDQFLVVRGPDDVPQKDILKVTVPLLLYPAYLAGDSPKGETTSGQKPDVSIPELLAKGGTYWSSVAKATIYGKERTEGTRFWISPLRDEVVLINRSDPRLRLAWATRTSKPALGEAELAGLGYDVQMDAIGRIAFFFGPIKGLRIDDHRGEVEFQLGDSIREYQGEGEFLVHLHIKGEPASNFLKLKVKLAD